MLTFLAPLCWALPVTVIVGAVTGDWGRAVIQPVIAFALCLREFSEPRSMRRTSACPAPASCSAYGERGLCQAVARLKQERISGDRQHDFPSEGISI